MQLAKHHLIYIFTGIVCAFILALNLTLVPTAQAVNQPPSQWLNTVQNNGLNQIGTTAFGTNKPKDIRTIAANLINVFLGFLGVIFIALMVAAGFMWMTAAGNTDKVSKAQKLMAMAAIGLLIILAAFAISLYVTSRTIYSVQQGLEPGGGEQVPNNDIKTNDKFNRLY